MAEDLLFPSDNEWDIPTLRLEQTELAPAVEAPVVVWGSSRRGRVETGTLCFYTDDYRFAAVWDDPSGCAGAGALVECNYSVFDDSPAAVALWATYRKRWLACYWQAAGAQVWVDLCVGCRHAALNLLGVPRGWQRFATAGWDGRVADLDTEITVARQQAAGWPFTLLVYGGGVSVRAWCQGQPEVVHVGHRADARKRPGQGTREPERGHANTKALTIAGQGLPGRQTSETLPHPGRPRERHGDADRKVDSGAR